MLKRLIFILLVVFFSIDLFGLDDNTNITDKNVEEWILKSKSTLNPDLFYNLGIYYSSLTNHGMAILYLKKAYLLASKDKKIKDAFENERRKIDVGVPLYEPSIIEKIITFPFNFAPLNVMFLFGLLIYSAGSILIFLNLFRLKKLSFITKFFEYKKVIITGLILLVIGFTYLVVSIFKYRNVFNKKEAVIINDGFLFDRPEANSIVIAKVMGGTECKILLEEGEYYLVNTIAGKEGYIVTNIVERLW